MAFVLFAATSESPRLFVEKSDVLLASLPIGYAVCLGHATIGRSYYAEGEVFPAAEAAHVARHGTGAFNLLVAEPSGAFRILQDRLGLNPLYIYERNGVHAISDSLWTLGQRLRSEGLEVSLDRDVFDLYLASDKFVAEQPLTLDTMVSGARVAVPGSSLVIDAQGVTETPRVGLGRGELSDAEYQALLAQAADEITDNVRSALETGRFQQVYADVTGGRESRALLGALARTEGVQAVRFRHRSSGMVEGFLVQSLVATVGGQFLSKAPGRAEPMTVDDYLDEQFERYFGANHSLMSNISARMTSQEGTVLLRGGLGAVFGTPYAPSSFDAAGEAPFAFAHLLNKRDLLPAGRRDAALERLRAGLESMPGESEDEQHYWHYRYLRNRFHLGLANRYAGFHVVTPLYSHAALDLAEQVPVEALTSGQLLRDLVAALDANLANPPYAEDFEAGNVPTSAFERMPLVTYDPALKTWSSGMGPKRNQVRVDESIYQQTEELAQWYFAEVEPEGGLDSVRYLQALQRNIEQRKLKFVVRDWFKFRAAAHLLNRSRPLFQ